MAKPIHISTALHILNSGDSVILLVWKSDGSILQLHNCISLRYNYYGGWRNVKFLTSGEIRRIRDICIFAVHGLEVFCKTVAYLAEKEYFCIKYLIIYEKNIFCAFTCFHFD